MRCMKNLFSCKVCSWEESYETHFQRHKKFLSVSPLFFLSLSLARRKTSRRNSGGRKAGASAVHAKDRRAFLRFSRRKSRSEAIFFCTFKNVVVGKVGSDGASSSRIRFDDDDNRNDSNNAEQQEQQQQREEEEREQNHRRFPRKNALRNSFKSIATTNWLRRSRPRRQRESLATRKLSVL